MKAVASRVTEKSDVLLLTAVDMDDSGPYEIAEPRTITALETYTPSCKPISLGAIIPHLLIISRAPNSTLKAACRNCLGSGYRPARETRICSRGCQRSYRQRAQRCINYLYLCIAPPLAHNHHPPLRFSCTIFSRHVFWKISYIGFKGLLYMEGSSLLA